MQNAPSKAVDRVADRLREIRKDKGLSQDDLAKTAGFARTNLAFIEQKRRHNLRISTLERLAVALDVDLVDLFAHQITNQQPNPEQGASFRLAANLRVSRELLHLSQEALSQKAGFFRNYVGRIENQASQPTLTDAERLASALGIDVAQLFYPLMSTANVKSS